MAPESAPNGPLGLGQFAKGVQLWSKMIATAPDKRPTVFRNCIAEGASFVRKGAPRGLIAAELIERAERHELVEELGGREAVETIVAEGLNKPIPEPELPEESPQWLPELEPAPPAPSLPFINFRDWDSQDVPEQDWVVLNRLPRRQTALFSGEGAIGKSMTLLYLCAACTLGRDWLGTVPEMGPALFIDAEDEEQVIHRRLAAVVKHYGTTFTELADGGLEMMSLAGQDAVMAVQSRGGKIMPTPLYDLIYQAIGDLKPVIIGMASSANFFAGNEIDRSQVQQFIGLMTRLAIVANGTVVLLSHPSLTGLASGSGLSGNTAWHSSVRARFYMRGVKKDDDEEDESGLREIVFKKSNYGPLAETLVLEWRDGMFLPKPQISSLDQAAQQMQHEDLFLKLLRRLSGEGRSVGHKKGPSYAPAVFADQPEAMAAKVAGKMFEAAMERLFEKQGIVVQQYGRPSRPNFRIVGC